MKSSHTPGPWEWSECGAFSAVVYIGHNTIGGVYKGGDEDILSPADARLIAASPELLEACKAIAELAKYADGAFNPDIIKICNAAISKAEGK